MKPTVAANTNQIPDRCLKQVISISDLVIAVSEIYPRQLTDNPWEEIPFTNTEKHICAESIYKTLVHSITLINHKHRNRNKRGFIITQQEDIEAATSIMKTLEGMLKWD